ncbi:hypothetical protein [Anaeromicropila populeti]|uniref:Uncharacterized protein n=1 Tax=Anaeromicropila populeti TaxID=37658 RepID=A0A1I6KN48_9FIRM|nr:hypothetical protein [Anaeromicropila populeti]SFR92330.1 hypothetical protein SAMN05661086_02537 [Anaeromicropila populeti]
MTRREMIIRTPRVFLRIIFVLIFGTISGSFIFFEPNNQAIVITSIILLIVTISMLFLFKIIAYTFDIIKKRTITLEGTLKQLVFREDYEDRFEPIGYEMYELHVEKSDKIVFSIGSKMYINEPKADKVRCLFLEKSKELLDIEVITYVNQRSKKIIPNNRTIEKRKQLKSRKR